ncbi:hypothetical protein RM572_05870 [Streptomyces sp. DSM 42041]|uniref:Histidine kinase/HSP90-like ATPase domain-containing protein n=1 Tax=Streptomyces hazeniae TaxID=3075538 RepID=A0ABU2NNZ0_9ACTN|nr:ATP-binding protein [Streptomyces sp. DSM 42041]MDT0378306.1 hypothetical protein [Streptomyces sp. DSM 42041]
MAVGFVPILRLRIPGGKPEARSGLQRAQSFMILATLLYRASHLTAGVVAVTKYQRDRPLHSAMLAVALGLSALSYGTALRHGWFRRWHVWVDVLVVGCALPFVLWAGGGVPEPSTIGWAMLLGGSASATAAIAFERLHVPAAVLLLVVTHLVGYQMVGAGPAVHVGHVNSLLSSAVMAWVFWWYLRRQGQLLDDANARALAAEAHKARYAERLEHHRKLHDTVLATLTTLAAGGIDANAAQVRERCGREAAYLRRLIEQTADEVPERRIGAALEEAVGCAESLGLRVTARYHRLPDVPHEVAAALGDAVREALNNVRRHAGTGHAYLTAAGSTEGAEGGQGGGEVVVTVVDRGPGFDPEQYAPGMGLRGSVCARMAEVDGSATVDTAPGEGVRVELRWPR